MVPPRPNLALTRSPVHYPSKLDAFLDAPTLAAAGRSDAAATGEGSRHLSGSSVAADLVQARRPDQPRLWGNKARKLEHLVADALARAATVLVTEGTVRSNHARLTGAAAAAGLECLLILEARDGDAVEANLLLDHLVGAEVRIVQNQLSRKKVMATVGDELPAKGQQQYVISTGASTPIGQQPPSPSSWNS